MKGSGIGKLVLESGIDVLGYLRVVGEEDSTSLDTSTRTVTTSSTTYTSKKQAIIFEDNVYKINCDIDRNLEHYFGDCYLYRDGKKCSLKDHIPSYIKLKPYNQNILGYDAQYRNNLSIKNTKKYYKSKKVNRRRLKVDRFKR